MNAAILCPGPSLSAVTQADLVDYDIRLGVNRAPLQIAVEYWCVLDYPIIRDYRQQVLGNPSLMTHSTTWNDIRGKVAPFPVRIPLENVEAWYGRKYERRTTPSAMLLAGYLGAETIDIYGDDKTSEPDWDGFQTAETALARSIERWQSEKRDCDAITEFLAARGIEVRHCSVEVTS